MKKNDIAQNLYFVSILTVITAVTWIFVDIYRTLNKPQTTSVPAEVIEPLNPQIDMDALDRLAKRKEFTSSEIIVPAISPTPTINLTPSPTIQPTQEISPAATTSANF